MMTANDTTTHYSDTLTSAYTVSVRETREKPEIVIARVDLPASSGLITGCRNCAEVVVRYRKGQGYFVDGNVWTEDPRTDGVVFRMCSPFSDPRLTVLVEPSKRYNARAMMALAVAVPHDAALHARLVSFLETADAYFRSK